MAQRMDQLPDDKYVKEFSESGLTNFIKKYAKKGGREFLIMLFKLWYSLPNASKTSIAIILAALGYAISPVDAIPDILPIVGLTDDAGILAATITAIAADITPEAEKKAEEKVDDILG